MQYIFVYILWGVHFKLRMLSLGVMLYILIYVCRSLDSLQSFSILQPTIYSLPEGIDPFIDSFSVIECERFKTKQ